jgi:peptidoglycan hydrolase CwlO-like protein
MNHSDQPLANYPTGDEVTARIDASFERLSKEVALALEKQMRWMIATMLFLFVSGITLTHNEIQGVHSEIQGIRSELQGVRSEIQGVRSEIQGVRSDTHTDIHSLRAEMQAMRQENTAEFRAIRESIETLQRQIAANAATPVQLPKK